MAPMLFPSAIPENILEPHHQGLRLKRIDNLFNPGGRGHILDFVYSSDDFGEGLPGILEKLIKSFERVEFERESGHGGQESVGIADSGLASPRALYLFESFSEHGGHSVGGKGFSGHDGNLLGGFIISK